MEYLFTSESIISFLILVVLEILLGIDNVIFVSIIMNRLQNVKEITKARRIWMFTGIISRSILLIGLGWLLHQKGNSIFTIFGKGFDLASLVMLAGGLFLIYKSVKEIHEKLEGEDPNAQNNGNKRLSLGMAIGQIMLIDAVFSFDSIITAGGTAKHVEIMIAAVMTSVGLMMVFARGISEFVSNHPTIKMLALSFLVVVGVVLIAEGFEHHIPKGYVYFAMAFSVCVEMLNIRLRKKSTLKT